MTTTKPIAKPTPGPWKFETVDTSIGICHKIGSWPSHGSHKESYACLYDDCGPGRMPTDEISETILANARLIAAAPDLLEACKFALKYHNFRLEKADDTEFPFQLSDAIQAAIAKATTHEP